MSVEINNISKTFSKHKETVIALDNITTSIKRGSIIGILGPNGAGKTTLTRILASLISADSGNAYIDGVNVNDHKKIRKFVSTIFGESGGRSLYYRLSIEDNLRFYATLTGIPKKVAKERIESLLSYFGLQHKKRALIMKLSTGMKAKVLMIKALIPKPRVLLLDEPTLGLDAESFAKTELLLKTFNKEFGTTIIITSHSLSDIDGLITRLILLDNGKIIRDSTPNDFKKIASKNYVDIEFFLKESLFQEFTKQTRNLAGASIISMTKVNEGFRNYYRGRFFAEEYSLEKTTSILNYLILENNGEVYKLQPYSPTLKEAFLSYIKTSKKLNENRKILYSMSKT